MRTVWPEKILPTTGSPAADVLVVDAVAAVGVVGAGFGAGFRSVSSLLMSWSSGCSDDDGFWPKRRLSSAGH